MKRLKKVFSIAFIMALCLTLFVSVYAAYENYSSYTDISSNSYLVGAKRSYSDDTFKLRLSSVKYKNDYTTHKARIGITDGNSWAYNTLGTKLISLPSENSTSSYTIGTFTSGNRCYSVSTSDPGPTVYDGFYADTLMWTE